MKINKVSDEATDVLLSREDYEKFFIYELDRISKARFWLLHLVYRQKLRGTSSLNAQKIH